MYLFELLAFITLLLHAPYRLWKFIKGKKYKKKYSWIYPVTYVYVMTVLGFLLIHKSLGIPFYVFAILLFLTVPIYVAIEYYFPLADEENEENEENKKEDIDKGNSNKAS